MKKIILAIAFLCFSLGSSARAVELALGDAAPAFSTKTQDGSKFELESRRGKWTVLFFYPKASTPGCTKQACAFRDRIEDIRKLGAEVYGVSMDTVEAQSQFHKAQKLNFTLLADADGKIVALYGSKMPVLSLSKRWTLIIDPSLKVRNIDKDVDPVKDATKVAAKIEELKKASQPQ